MIFQFYLSLILICKEQKGIKMEDISSKEEPVLTGNFPINLIDMEQKPDQTRKTSSFTITSICKMYFLAFIMFALLVMEIMDLLRNEKMQYFIEKMLNKTQ
jgi:hypothetical protein